MSDLATRRPTLDQIFLRWGVPVRPGLIDDVYEWADLTARTIAEESAVDDGAEPLSPNDRPVAWGSDFRHLLIFACLAALFKESDGWTGMLAVAVLGAFTLPSVVAEARRIFWRIPSDRKASHEE